MKKSIFIPLFFTSILLAACSDDKPSDALFEKTINQFSEKEGVCLPLVLNVQGQKSIETFTQVPLGMTEIKLPEKDSKGNNINQTALKQMDLLYNEGFYDKTNTEVPSVNGDDDIQILVYNLTEKGNKQIRGNKKTDPRFCIGTQKVEKINWYTEPSPFNGMTISRVSYEARFIPEKWLADLFKAGGSNKLPLSMEEVRIQTATLVKTNEGWKDSRELR